MTREELRIIESYFNLLIAIRDKAESDGMIDDFYDYWYYSDRMRKVWSVIGAEINTLIDGV